MLLVAAASRPWTELGDPQDVCIARATGYLGQTNDQMRAAAPVTIAALESAPAQPVVGEEGDTPPAQRKIVG